MGLEISIVMFMYLPFIFLSAVCHYFPEPFLWSHNMRDGMLHNSISWMAPPCFLYFLSVNLFLCLL